MKFNIGDKVHVHDRPDVSGSVVKLESIEEKIIVYIRLDNPLSEDVYDFYGLESDFVFFE